VVGSVPACPGGEAHIAEVPAYHPGNVDGVGRASVEGQLINHAIAALPACGRDAVERRRCRTAPRYMERSHRWASRESYAG
jgi:hypothetical protein